MVVTKRRSSNADLATAFLGDEVEVEAPLRMPPNTRLWTMLTQVWEAARARLCHHAHGR